jgi:hypothetical protein
MWFSNWISGSIGLAVLAMLDVTSASADEVLFDPLDGSTSGVRDGGTFEDGGGWRSPRQIRWDAGEDIVSGGMSVVVTNWDPSADSAQHHHEKQQIINMFEGPGCDQKAQFDLGLANFQIRTGTSYNDLFKFLADPGGEREETRLSPPDGPIDPEQSYTIRVEWNDRGDITVFLDEVSLHTFAFGRPFQLRTVCIGTDDTAPGVYGPQHDVIYSDLRVWSDGVSLPDAPADAGRADAGATDAGGERVVVLGPIADSWIDPGRSDTPLGSDTELRIGSDGRAAFFAFDIAVDGRVVDASLELQALNAGGGGDIRTVGTDWEESTLTFGNAPRVDGPILDSLGRVEIDGTYLFDVSEAITGSGISAFVITSAVDDGSGYHSRESVSGTRPRLTLVITEGRGDASEPDAGVPDAGEPDAGVPDAGAPDPRADAGDAGPGPDVSDTVSREDISVNADTNADSQRRPIPDSEGVDDEAADADSVDGEISVTFTGEACGCSAATRSSSLLLLLPLLLLLFLLCGPIEPRTSNLKAL